MKIKAENFTNLEKPIVLINAGTHGTEKVGLKIIQSLKKALKSKPLLRGTLITNIANKKALKNNKRFIDQDLNRSFPGKRGGNHEQRLAHGLLPLIKKCDVVVDIHSTESSVHSSIIVTKLNKKTLEIVRAISPAYLLFMKATENNALISAAKNGIAFEYGNDKSLQTFKQTLSGIYALLAHLGMIPRSTKTKKIRTQYFEVYKVTPKPEGYSVASHVKNFTKISKGEIFAINKKDKKHIQATENFYPILFGEKNYKDIFGFQGKKRKL